MKILPFLREVRREEKRRQVATDRWGSGLKRRDRAAQLKRQHYQGTSDLITVRQRRVSRRDLKEVKEESLWMLAGKSY